MDMRIEKSWDGEKLDVRLYGEIDIISAPEFKAELAEAQKATDVHVECGQLEYIDSTGIGVMVSVLKKVRERGGSVVVADLKPHLRKIFVLTNLDKLFELRDGESA